MLPYCHLLHDHVLPDNGLPVRASVRTRPTATQIDIFFGGNDGLAHETS
jgi:hypothetical protein